MFDATVFLGHWPFRRFRGSTAEQLTWHLRREGVLGALVSSLDSVFRDDLDACNRSLMTAVSRYRHLKPAITINPQYADWPILLDKYPSPAVRLFPNYHGYSLSSLAVDAVCDELRRRNIVLIVTVRLEDERTHPSCCLVPAVPMQDIVRLAGRFPRLPIIGSGTSFQNIVTLASAREKNIYVDYALAERLNTLESILQIWPVSRLLFGSCHPFCYTRSAVLKLTTARLSTDTRRRIARINATRLLHIHRPSTKEITNTL